MTGEMFALLSTQSTSPAHRTSTIGELVRPFQRGAEGIAIGRGRCGFDAHGLLCENLGSDRAFGKSASNYLSGLMIGAAICSVLGKQATNDALSLTICGNKELSSRYTRALNIFGIDQVRELQGTAPRESGPLQAHKASCNLRSEFTKLRPHHLSRKVLP